MKLETVLTCPLGHKCEEIKDNAINRCAWFTKLAGKNPTTGESVDEHGCAMTWMPVLLIENSMQQRSTSAAIESFRNEMVRGQQETAKLLENQSSRIAKNASVHHPLPALATDHHC